MSFLIDLFLILFFQPFFPFIFFLQPGILDLFFKNKIKELNFRLILFSFLTDLIFIQTLGFFLLLNSFTLLVISVFEKFIFPNKIFQKIIFLLIFNFVFLLMLFSYKKIFVLNLFIKFLIVNLFFQIIYLFFKKSL